METGQGQPVGDLSDVLQEADRPELGLPVSVPVSVDGPVQTHVVPSVSAGSRSFTVTATEPKRVGNGDPRRRVLRIISTAGAFYVGPTQNEVQSAYAALWPANVVLELTHSDPVYVRAATTDVSLSVITENWAS